MKDFTSLFLSQSYKDMWGDYKRSLDSAEFLCWDYIFITASSPSQAEGFEMQIVSRQKAGLLPEKTKFIVVPDYNGLRIGSGGATLAVIDRLQKETKIKDFKGLRTLVIHSGGDSKRVPQYSALGKLFSPVPHELPNGKSSTLFDEFIIAMSSVPSRIREGMLILSGDVLLLFNPLQIDYAGKDGAAISFKEDVKTGKNHGVYLPSKNGYVKKFLHKQSEEKLNEFGAVDEKGCVDIDTGAVIFSSKIQQILYSLVDSKEKFDSLVNDRVRLSLYGDFLYPLASDSTLDDFLLEKPEGEMCEELIKARKLVFESLSGQKLKLLRFSPAKFIHFGTTNEIMKLMTGGVSKYSELDWSSKINSSINGKTAGYNSVFSSRAQIGENCYLESSYVHHGSVVGDNVLLSFIDVKGNKIPSNVVVHGLKQKNGKFVVRIFGINDNPKEDKLFGISINEIIKQLDISEGDIFDDKDHSLWKARLYAECESIETALEKALNLYKIIVEKEDKKDFLSLTRKSLQSGFNDADSSALLDWNERMQDFVKMDKLAKLIKDKSPASQNKILAGENKLKPIQAKWLERRLKDCDFYEAIRLQYYTGQALGGTEGSRYISECFKTIKNQILKAQIVDLKYNDKAKMVKDKHVVKLPLRVNWGGGWTDTPPYCNENGGTVLNCAITLNGQRPVEVILTKLKEKKIIFSSKDMDVYGEFDNLEELQSTGDPYDEFALQKAGLLACGIIPEKGGKLNDILEKLDGGFMMESEVTGVPKGSGLGTSSILSACVVKALLEFMGIEYLEEDLYSKVLVMEQIMSTGGGWQDQVGGATDGIKYITTTSGLKQEIKVEHVEISEQTKKELNERFVLIYTGQRRLARNLLRGVVGKYIGNEVETVKALDKIKDLAYSMKKALEKGDVEEFAGLLNLHWECSKKIDPESTNRLIDQIFLSVEDFTAGKLICGAGGGGFLQIILKKGVTKDRVRKRLKDIFRDNGIDVWNCTLV